MRESLQIMQPEYEMLEDGIENDWVDMGRVVPVYAATAHLTQKYMRRLIFEAISKYSRFLPEALPSYILARDKLVDVKFAVRNIHFPDNLDNLERSYRRIVFGEFLLLQLALAIKKKEVSAAASGHRHVILPGGMEEFVKSLPFELTASQKKAMEDIGRDMLSSRPMNRLLEGDVGSGKTVVASYALMLTARNGFQGVLMAPTEVLARQHYLTLSELLMPLGINVSFLAGGMEPEARRRIRSGAADGDIDIIVGTHAVIQDGLEFKKLGLAIVDEQHKFGVEQRAVLRRKGDSPHMLVMTATPIPRTLALTVYGDLDISVMRELPKGRTGIITYWVGQDKRDSVYNFVKDELKRGRQAYVICPVIGTSAKSFPMSRKPTTGQARLKTQSALGLFGRLRGEFADYEVGLLHGRMSFSEKEIVMKAFRSGKLNVLVSTVVIEVGVDVPNASVMVIENADMFGLSQLHQLRGRVGRGKYESYCILLADPGNESALKRLQTIENTADGFRIAETDLELRGSGEFFGKRQHGLPEIRFGNIIRDLNIMESSRRRAFGIVEADPDLSEERHAALKRAVLSRFKDRIDLVNVA
jgi:ATP-dependent DNA helicase RecG